MAQVDINEDWVKTRVKLDEDNLGKFLLLVICIPGWNAAFFCAGDFISLIYYMVFFLCSIITPER